MCSHYFLARNHDVWIVRLGDGDRLFDGVSGDRPE